MRPPGTAQQSEKLRRQAMQLLKAGKSLSVVARAVSASVSSVFRWHQTFQAKGVQVLLKGPLAAGYRTDLWTLQRVAKVIGQQFGVQYHPCHVWKLLGSLGWSCQKPERRALQRDEKAIRRWRRERWPHIKKRRKAWGSSGFSR